MNVRSPAYLRGKALSEQGLHIEDLVADLDETIWDWCYLIARQPQFFRAHDEIIYLRRPLLELLAGIASGGGQLRLWTAGYGERVDRIADAAPEVGRLFGIPRGDRSEAQPHIATRLDFHRALLARPELVRRDGARWIGQKVPGAPTVAGKPLVDGASIMLDDKESNCRRFVASGTGRSALWLRGAPRIWRNNLRLVRRWAPPGRSWVDGIADAFDRILAGETGLYPIDPVPSDHAPWEVRVSMPHPVVWNDWIAPGRAIDRITGRR